MQTLKEWLIDNMEKGVLSQTEPEGILPGEPMEGEGGQQPIPEEMFSIWVYDASEFARVPQEEDNYTTRNLGRSVNYMLEGLEDAFAITAIEEMWYDMPVAETSYDGEHHIWRVVLASKN